ncbi:MAG: sulfatase [Kiritimatiellia bacterium]
MTSGAPNILYIHSHDTGRYIQPYGYAVPTPNLQKLAEEGVLFRRNFCANPTCSPSRAAMLTGTYPHQTGMWGLAHRGWDMNDYGEHIIHTLKKAGYRTALSGIQHIVHHNRTDEIGYDEVLIPPGAAGSPELAASSWLHRQKKAEQPFFLSVGFGETHRAFPGDGWTVNPNYLMPPSPIPDTRSTREDMAGFITWAGVLDRKMGVVFNTLRDAGLWDNTLIICTTDHGIAFPRMKCNLTDPGIGVMLIMHGPGGYTGGRAVDALVSHLDIFPTICDAAGIEAPKRCTGSSIRPLVTGQADSIRDEIHAEVNYHACYEPMRCVRTDRYKYIRRYSDRDKPVLPNCDQSPSKDLIMEAGWYPVEREMLYDTILDPHETGNLAGKPEAEEVLADMQKRMARWQEETDDPILKGPLPAAPEAVFNDPDAVSPQSEMGPIDQYPQY